MGLNENQALITTYNFDYSIAVQLYCVDTITSIEAGIMEQQRDFCARHAAMLLALAEKEVFTPNLGQVSPRMASEWTAMVINIDSRSENGGIKIPSLEVRGPELLSN